MNTDFLKRHIGPSEAEIPAMLKATGLTSITELIQQTIPQSIRSDKQAQLGEALSEAEYLDHIRNVAQKNASFKSCIGMGYYGTYVPSVIARNIFENPGWYTQYTPYQPEISQGRLEALFNFQTMITDLTAMDIANASLLDEATAAAEAMTMLHRLRDKELEKKEANTFLVSDKVFLQTRNVLQTRAEPLGITIQTFSELESVSLDHVYAVIFQYPDQDGVVHDFKETIAKLATQGIRTVMACDLMALAVLTPPGELGVDVAIGSSQRFGVPMGFGGPHAAFFATHDDFKRSMSGRLVGLSIDIHKNPAYRLALQTREQHIRREKATSNICTAQALLAIMAGMYAVYHGPDGIRSIATEIHTKTRTLAKALKEAGFEQQNTSFFDTLLITVNPEQLKSIQQKALDRCINFRYTEDSKIGIAIDETITWQDLESILACFVSNAKLSKNETVAFSILPQCMRKSAYLQHEVFNSYHNETSMMRYIRNLENRDLALNTAMIPLGSCTMKLNSATSMMPLSMPEFANVHPFAPDNQVAGYFEIINWLSSALASITGFVATSLQPNSGAQGEYAGLLAIRAYQKSQGESRRKIALIPASAHGTNPASASMAGMQVVVVKCDSQGNIDLEDLKAKAEKYAKILSCLMVTYPSTHGVFEESIKEICHLIHEKGGQVYMDGANLNAQLGYTSPGEIGADVCHLNLHKTFAIPHGGGGPGLGPICVAKHLVDFLPQHPLAKTAPEFSVTAISAAPYSSASILLISYAYIRMLGAAGLKQVTNMAILNANYLKARLEKYYKILYQGKNNFIAHEMILDTRPFKAHGIEVDDIAKRLMDYGFHAPTMSFPVPGTLMVEPTESEPLSELDRFCDAMIAIKQEIDEIISGKADAKENMLKNAPHTAQFLLESRELPYSKLQAAYPLKNQNQAKFWPFVGRIDNVYGDRNLVCSCLPISDYENDGQS